MQRPVHNLFCYSKPFVELPLVSQEIVSPSAAMTSHHRSNQIVAQQQETQEFRRQNFDRRKTQTLEFSPTRDRNDHRTTHFQNSVKNSLRLCYPFILNTRKYKPANGQYICELIKLFHPRSKNEIVIATFIFKYLKSLKYNNDEV
ncbi:hypothetical protein KIL84_012696 [Mauremys mutica]|uniref:Uncharacterized protein n=1 Tax=Mauremys mutica TaxID=74926 RepID=A0A9D4B8U5_9SAUR|nr:hypothetical protein KIL84_012696 [Mauremys mutica]